VPTGVSSSKANAFLHHMIRNIMGCLVAIGQGAKPASWMAEVLAARSPRRRRAHASRPMACTSSARSIDAALGPAGAARLRMIALP
jgi:tRNA pseudouridine38-40 synthase